LLHGEIYYVLIRYPSSVLLFLICFPHTTLYYIHLFFFYCSADHRDLHSFPTRRSSDLRRTCVSTTTSLGLRCRAGTANSWPSARTSSTRSVRRFRSRKRRCANLRRARATG